jgi:hypothetical protein
LNAKIGAVAEKNIWIKEKEVTGGCRKMHNEVLRN